MERIHRELKVVPKEIDSETKLNKFFSLKDLIFVLCGMFISYNFIELVYPAYRMFYTGYVAVICALCLIPSFGANEGKKLYHTLYFLLIKRRVTYRSVDTTIYDEKEGDHDV